MQEIMRKIAILRALEDMVKRELGYQKDVGIYEMERLGVERASASLNDGTIVGRVTRVSPVGSFQIANEDAALAWAKDNAPYMVEEVPEDVKVIPAHERLVPGGADALLRMVEEDGVVVEGVRFKVTEPYIKVAFEPGGRELIALELKNNSLDTVARGLLTEGEDDE